MNNVINLVFSNSTTALAGNPYGRKEFARQVKELFDYNKINVIVFPNQIDKVASSFTQGFFAEIVNKVGYANFDNVVQIKAKNEKLENSIRSDLFV